MEPFDLDAAAALRAEATGEGPQFTFRGVSFTMIPLGEMDWSLLELLDANMRQGLTALLGGQADKFWELKPTVIEVMTLREEMIARYGGGLAGESEASSTSSVRTAKRSKQPSPRTSRPSAAATSA